MTTYTVSAPGKVILHGEHAVVYGKAAVAVSVDLRTTATLSPHESGVVLELPDLKWKAEWTHQQLSDLNSTTCAEEGTVVPSDILVPHLSTLLDLWDRSVSERQAATAFLFLYVGIALRHGSGAFPGVRLEVKSQLPIGAGLGSSAAYAVALSGALLSHWGLFDDKELISGWAYQAERILHGKPSGIDNSICTYGGALLFRSGKIVERNERIPSIYKVVLVDTRVSRNTRSLVQSVRERYERLPNIIGPVLEAIDGISERCWELLGEQANLVSRFGEASELIQMNASLLNALGVGHPRLDHITRLAADHGLAAKLTGAGGGGCALLLLPPGKSSNDIQRCLKEANFLCWEASLGCRGVSLDSSTDDRCST